MDVLSKLLPGIKSSDLFSISDNDKISTIVNLVTASLSKNIQLTSNQVKILKIFLLDFFDLLFF